MDHKDKHAMVFASNKFVALMLDKGGVGSGPNEDKTVATFQVLDTIIPRLGVFAEVVKLCRNEIFDAVYSEDLTSSVDHSMGDGNLYVQRIPYFLVNKRLIEEQLDQKTASEETISKLSDDLIFKERIHVEAQRRIEKMEEIQRTLNESVFHLEAKVTDKELQIKSLGAEIEHLKKTASEAEARLNREIAKLKLHLETSASENDYLRNFKNNYDRMQNAFQNWNGLERSSQQQKRRENTPNQMFTTLSDVSTCRKLEEQLLNVQNSLIEEFDEFMEAVTEVKLQFLPKCEMALVGLVNRDEEEDDGSETQYRMMATKDKFAKNISELNAELERVVRHRHQLQKKLQDARDTESIEQQRRSSEEELIGTPSQESKPKTAGEPLHVVNPFIPDEGILNKYAVMLFASDDNGSTFFEFKDAKYCSSCHEKTVICPHGELKEEQIVTLAPGVTHIKLVTPRIRANLEQLEQNPTQPVATSAAPFMEKRSHSVAEIYLKKTIDCIWSDYRKRTSTKRKIPRLLSADRTVLLIKQFVEFLLKEDLQSEHEKDYISVLDRLYTFFQGRYVNQKTSFLAIHDFFTSLIEHQVSEKLAFLCLQVLIGNLDASAIRYVLLIRNLAEGVTWKQVEDFKTFASILYPFLGEDDVETLQLGFVSFGENRIDVNLVVDYIAFIIMKYREPRFLEMESLLINHPSGVSGSMTESEFLVSSEQVVFAFDRLQRHLFRQSAADVTGGADDRVSTLRLSQISSYVYLVSSAYQMKRQLRTWQIDPTKTRI